MDAEDNITPVEFFAAKDKTGIFMSVSHKCGLKEADTLRIDGLSMVVLKNLSILPIDLPSLSEGSKAELVKLAAQNKPLPVAEFMARGLGDSYMLNLVIA